MQSLATPGSILVTEATYRLTEGYFAFNPLGAAQVKGVREPVPIYEVQDVGPLRTRLQLSARRGLVRFVGRQPELEHLQRAWDQAKRGQGQMVGVVGEPGVGKSRLCYEFKLLSRRGCLVLETFSVSHGKAYPYLPLIELLKHYFQLSPQETERRTREQVTGKVLTPDRSLEDTLSYLLALLGDAEATAVLAQMDPQIKRRRTFEAITRLLLRESLNQPLLLLIEDLHWLDNETQAWLQLLAERLATARILLLVNYRPEYQHSWGSKSYYTQLRLDPLEEALFMAQDLSHPFSMAIALVEAALVHQFRREGQATQARASAIIALSTEHGFPLWLSVGTIVRGWALAMQGQAEEGIAQMRQDFVRTIANRSKPKRLRNAGFER